MLEEEFMQRFHEGDNDAWKQIIKENEILLYKHAQKFISNKHEIEEIFAAALGGLWNNRLNIREKEVIRPYLYKSIRNGCLKYIKKQSLEISTQKTLTHIYEVQQADETYKKRVWDILKQILPLLDGLPELERNVLLLCHRDQLTDLEIAQKLGISIHTVYSKKSNGIKNLKELAAKYKSWLDVGLLVIFLLIWRDGSSPD